MAVYDPYTAKIVDILTFPNISHYPKYQIGGIGADKNSGLLSIVVDAGEAFNTAEQNISGTNYIMNGIPRARK